MEFIYREYDGYSEMVGVKEPTMQELIKALAIARLQAKHLEVTEESIKQEIKEIENEFGVDGYELELEDIKEEIEYYYEEIKSYFRWYVL